MSALTWLLEANTGVGMSALAVPAAAVGAYSLGGDPELS
jgi:hypothetical protein